jgi:hypothetical protein
MNTATALLAFTYTIVILALILARLSFFKVKPGKARFSALLYDPIVLITYLNIHKAKIHGRLSLPVQST